eukprot:6082253-Pyramimonas_sp.AAC.2
MCGGGGGGGGGGGECWGMTGGGARPSHPEGDEAVPGNSENPGGGARVAVPQVRRPRPPAGSAPAGRSLPLHGVPARAGALDPL